MPRTSNSPAPCQGSDSRTRPCTWNCWTRPDAASRPTRCRWTRRRGGRRPAGDLEAPGSRRLSETPQSTGYAASLTWRPPVPGNGFYTVRAALQQEDDLDLQHAVSFVVMRPSNRTFQERVRLVADEPRASPGDGTEMLKLLDLAHVSWLKCPAWCDPTDQAALRSTGGTGRSAGHVGHRDGRRARRSASRGSPSSSEAKNARRWPTCFWNRELWPVADRSAA